MRLIKSLVVLAAIISVAVFATLSTKMNAIAERTLSAADEVPGRYVDTVGQTHGKKRAPSSPAAFVQGLETVRYGNPVKLFLRSEAALIVDERVGTILYGRKIDEPRPIASLTKLMTAMVIRDAKLPLSEMIEITKADRDRLKGSKSRLPYGAVLTRHDLLQTALAASDNRAASALARSYPGGPEALLQAMNDKARELAMMQTHFADPSGLDSNNVSTARDLASLAYAIRAYPLISSLSTRERFRVTDWHAGADIDFHNTNYLVRKVSWEIELSKTGYTAEAGNCLLMRTTIAGRTLIIVLLSSWGKLSKFGDSNRIHAWLIDTEARLTDPASTAASTNK